MKAWLLDEDYLLEGEIKDNIFYPYADVKWVQEVYDEIIDKELFYDLDRAKATVGDILVIK